MESEVCSAISGGSRVRAKKSNKLIKNAASVLGTLEILGDRILNEMKNIPGRSQHKNVKIKQVSERNFSKSPLKLGSTVDPS